MLWRRAWGREDAAIFPRFAFRAMRRCNVIHRRPFHAIPNPRTTRSAFRKAQIGAARFPRPDTPTPSISHTPARSFPAATDVPARPARGVDSPRPLHPCARRDPRAVMQRDREKYAIPKDARFRAHLLAGPGTREEGRPIIATPFPGAPQ